jgi:parallel beta-helix repeat protein
MAAMTCPGTSWRLSALALAVVATLMAMPSASGAETTCSVRVHPGSDVRREVAAAGRDATVCFDDGTYRLAAPLRPRAGQTLLGRGAVLDGSRVLTGFTRVGDGWVVGDQHQQGERTGTCARGQACTYPNGVLRDGRALRLVLDRDRLRPGAFWFDHRRDRIVVADDPHGHRLEAMVAPAAIVSGGADVTVRGFTVEHFATRAQHGAIETSAPGWRIVDNTVQVNHGAGITTGGHVEVVGNRVLRNGQLGIGGTGADTLVAHNVIAFNNTVGFDPGWEAGGAKWAVTDHLVVRGNRVHGNDGPGLWTDIDAQDTTYVGNVVRNNTHVGIFHEISAAATIRDNVVTGNGHGFDAWLWGAGILIAGSHDVEVAGNRLGQNAAGIALIQQDRGRSDVDGTPRTLHDLSIHDNEVTMSRGPSGGVTDNGYDAMFSDPSITWTGNTWHGSGGRPFWWADDELTLAQWRDLGHDQVH